MTIKRPLTQRAADREALLATFTHEYWERVPAGTNKSDVAALVRAGLIETQVRHEWDKSTGHQANMFGGAAVMQRNRLYARKINHGGSTP